MAKVNLSKFHTQFSSKKTGLICYQTVKEFWRYVYPFWHNTGVWQIYKLCMALHKWEQNAS